MDAVDRFLHELIIARAGERRDQRDGALEGYSLTRAIEAQLKQRFAEDAPLEAAATRELAARSGMQCDPFRILVPTEILARDVSVASAGALVETDVHRDFTAALRARSVVLTLGAARFEQRGNVSIPRVTTGATVTWITSETAQITQADAVIGQTQLSPKTCGAFTRASRQLVRQGGPLADAVLGGDLAGAVGQAIDAAVFSGAGGASGQPTGIANTSGVHAISGATFAFATALDMEEAIGSANAEINPQTCAFVARSAVRKTLKQRPVIGTSVPMLWTEDKLADRRAVASENVPAATLIYGDFSQVVLVFFGPVAVEVNPYQDFRGGIVGLRVFASFDVLLRHPASFAVAGSFS